MTDLEFNISLAVGEALRRLPVDVHHNLSQTEEEHLRKVLTFMTAVEAESPDDKYFREDQAAGTRRYSAFRRAFPLDGQR